MSDLIHHDHAVSEARIALDAAARAVAMADARASQSTNPGEGVLCYMALVNALAHAGGAFVEALVARERALL